MILLKLLAGSCCRLAANVAFPIGFVPQSSFLQPSRMLLFSVELGFPNGEFHIPTNFESWNGSSVLRLGGSMSGWVKAHDAAWGRSIHSNPYQPISNFDIHHATKGFEPQKKSDFRYFAASCFSEGSINVDGWYPYASSILINLPIFDCSPSNQWIFITA